MENSEMKLLKKERNKRTSLIIYGVFLLFMYSGVLYLSLNGAFSIVTFIPIVFTAVWIKNFTDWKKLKKKSIK